MRWCEYLPEVWGKGVGRGNDGFKMGEYVEGLGR